MSNMLQVRIDDDLKTQATMVLDQLGIDLSTAVRMFLRKCVAVNGIPFEVKNDSNLDKTIAAVNNMRKTAEQNDISDLTLEEINEIILKSRQERKNR
ncbi:MAG: type II toxin-antitoxin system RelB/DinJ family antitoxin [Firmicutes bacterium]|nr:type II toxin-antitoxin system RelB/DinJ family antitoxin [Bacillota bacterium]